MTSWRQPQSEVVGGGQPRSGSVFRAKVALVCDWCSAPIHVGDTFTRSSRGPVQAAQWARLMRNVCMRCGAAGPPDSRTAKETP